MFKEELEQNCKSLCEYFEKIFNYNTSRLSHSIILYGLDAQLNYDFALELARLLNCQKDKTPDCDCLNCKWIRNNNHPSVKTYSNLENKNDSRKTVISIEQIKDIIEELSVSSDYKRVYIFCSAKKNKDDEIEHLHLTAEGINIAAANAFLKSIEEPPKNTYFIFITKDKNDLLPTIISRSQSFYVHSKQKELTYIEGLENIFRYYPIKDYLSAKEFIENLQNWQNDNDLDILTTLSYAQNYLNTLIKSNISDTLLTNLITADIMKFEQAKIQAQKSFKDDIIWENLIYKIYKD